MQIWTASRTARKWKIENVEHYIDEAARPHPLNQWLREIRRNLRKNTTKCYLVFTGKEVAEIVRQSKRWFEDKVRDPQTIAHEFVCRMIQDNGAGFVPTFISSNPKKHDLNDEYLAIEIRKEEEMLQPVRLKFKKTKCIHRLTPKDVNPGLQPEDVALPCKKDKRCPERKK